MEGSAVKKIPALFVRDWDGDRRYVLPEVTRGCEWVINGEGAPTRKYDGTCVMFDGDNWWARREVKRDKIPPAGFVEVEHDEEPSLTPGPQTCDLLTPEVLDELKRAFERACNDPDAAKKWRRQTLRDNLPRRVRLRLAVTSRIDRTAITLVDHGHHGAARRLWAVTGLWSGRRKP